VLAAASSACCASALMVGSTLTASARTASAAEAAYAVSAAALPAAGALSQAARAPTTPALVWVTPATSSALLSTPFMLVYTCQVLGAASFTKYVVRVCGLPSVSYTLIGLCLL